MQLPFNEQVQRFVSRHGVEVFAALGFTKATEVVVRHYFGVWWARAAAFFVFSLGVLWVAARSKSIDL